MFGIMMALALLIVSSLFPDIPGTWRDIKYLSFLIGLVTLVLVFLIFIREEVEHAAQEVVAAEKSRSIEDVEDFSKDIHSEEVSSSEDYSRRVRISTGTKWEPIVGYSRLVKVRNQVFVSGTTSTDETGLVVFLGDPYRQTVQALKNIERALMKIGLNMQHVVRTRIFLTTISNWEAVGRAHGEIFHDIRPASTMVEVARLVDPDMLVEIEADAVS